MDTSIDADTDASSPEGLEFERLERRMLTRFSPPLQSEDVRRCVRSCMAMFSSAPIRKYVALLVERVVVEQLSADLRALDVATEDVADVAARRVEPTLVDTRPLAHSGAPS